MAIELAEDNLPVTLLGSEPAEGQTVEGHYYTAEQIRFALAACRTLATAYAQTKASEGASIDWTDIDDAWNFAKHALDEDELVAIQQAADRAAGEGEDVVYEDTPVDFTDAIVTAPGESLIATVSAERKKVDDTEGGTCD